MLPALAGILGRSAVTQGATRSAVTSAAQSGAISAGAGTAVGAGSNRVLSGMQFGSAANRAMDATGGSQNSQPAPAPSGPDGLGWARS